MVGLRRLRVTSACSDDPPPPSSPSNPPPSPPPHPPPPPQGELGNYAVSWEEQRRRSSSPEMSRCSDATQEPKNAAWHQVCREVGEVGEVGEVRVLREERRPRCDVIGGNSDAENPFVTCCLLLRSVTLRSSGFHLHMRSRPKRRRLVIIHVKAAAPDRRSAVVVAVVLIFVLLRRASFQGRSLLSVAGEKTHFPSRRRLLGPYF